MKSPFTAWLELNLSARILIGLGFGILAGLFLGEPAAELQPIADIYIRLMQMMVLPYLVTALIIAFGQLSAHEATRLALRGGALLVVVWVIAAAVISLAPITFPDFKSATFFSHGLIEPTQPFSFAELYFTANPFESLSRNIVPAVVLFSCLIGIGVMGLEGKDRLLAPLRVRNAAVVRITMFIVELTPVGVFAIGAVAAGTIDLETLARLEVYLVAFTAVSLLLTFWILPLLVTAVTPFSYSEVAGIARGALLTAFVANNAFIVLPILVERSKTLFERHGLLDENTDSAAEVMVPVLFNFPNAGKLLTLLFVPFAAWLSGAPLAASDYSTLFAAGIPSYFAKAQVALPFLLDLFRLPHDLFQLYVPTTIVTGKLDSLVTAANLLIFGLLGGAAMGGFLVFERKRLVRTAISLVGGTALVLLATRMTLAVAIDTSYHMDEAVLRMHHGTRAVDTVVHRELSDELAGASDGRHVLERIRARGTLRIGYDPNNLPFSFFNSAGELVGFDVELAEQLTAAFHVKAEFVPISWPEVPRLLAEGVIDVMPGMWYRPYWFSKLRLTDPYLIGTLGFAVRDDFRHQFSSVEALRRSSGLKIGVPLDTSQLEHSMRHYFGDADVEFVAVEFWKPFFEGKHPDLDAFLMPAEHASGWSLLYPDYAVVVPQPDPVRVPSAFGVALDSEELVAFIDEWIVFAENSGVIDQQLKYWVFGEGAQSSEPRWSIMRNVLGWGR